MVLYLIPICEGNKPNKRHYITFIGLRHFPSCREIGLRLPLTGAPVPVNAKI
jgi:hypothetical protein